MSVAAELASAHPKFIYKMMGGDKLRSYEII